MERETFLKKLQNFDIIEKPLFGRIFESKESMYFYDSPSGEIIKIRFLMKELIDSLLKKKKALRLQKLFEIALRHSEDKVLKGIHIINLKRKNDNIFKARPEKFDVSIKEQYQPQKANLYQLVIEVTQNCNMRCKYCIYGGTYVNERNHSPLVINKNTARKAIKYFLDNPGHPKPIITFFGGEPLLNQNLIEFCIKYAKQINPNTKFYITTNGLLLNPINFDFIQKYQIMVGISLDGPRAIHDSYRILPGGEGTFDIIKGNIEKMYKANANYLKNNFRLLVTLTDIKNLKKISVFLKNNQLFKNLPISINKIMTIGLKENKKEFNNRLPDNKYLRSLLNVYVENCNEENFKNVTAEHGYFFPLYKLISNRTPLKEKFYLKKACVLGDWRLFSDVKGNFRICEKTDRLPVIGNINSGINWDLIDNMKQDFLAACETCKYCWAVGICDICWIDIYNEKGKLCMDTKKNICKIKLREHQIGLKAYIELTEKYGDFFKRIPS